MSAIVPPKPIRPICLSNVLTAVLAICVLLASQSATAQNKCRNVVVRDGPAEVVDNRKVARALKKADPAFAAELLGGVGFKIFEFERNGGGPTVLVKNEPRYSEAREKALELMHARPRETSPELQQIVEDMFHPRVLPNETVLIAMPYLSWLTPDIINRGDANFAFKLNMRVEQLYQKTATWVYQKDGLEPTDPFTSGTMADESVNYSFQKRPLHYFMLFDKGIWHEQMRFFEECWKLYTQDPSGSALELKFITPDVFWPRAGVALAVPSSDPTLPVEVKRYFKNDIADPLELTKGLGTKDDFTLRNELLLAALQSIPPDRSLQIHSHTRVHTIAYRKLGFVVQSQILNPHYPEASVDLLQAQNGQVITKLKLLLQSRGASSQAPQDK